MGWRGYLLRTSICLALFFHSIASEPYNVFTRRFFHKGVNVNSQASIDDAKQIMERAAKAGYNGMFTEDVKFHIPVVHKLASEQIANFKQILAEGKRLEMPIIPMSLGFLLASKYDLANGEALPIRGQNYVVKRGEAVPVNGPLTVANPGFEQFSGNTIAAWSPKNTGLGAGCYIDTQEKHGGAASIRFENPKVKKVQIIHSDIGNLKPFHAYLVSVWIKTENLVQPRDAGVQVYGASRWLLKFRDKIGVRPTQDWTKHTWCFNSLEATSISLRLMASSTFTSTGKIWFDDIEIQEANLWRLQSRSTTPVVVKSAAKPSVTYTEGTDFKVEGTVYEDGNGKLIIPNGSSIQEGDALLVDWYSLAITETHRPSGSYCHDEAWEIAQRNSKALHELFESPKGWHQKPSEWRLAYWDPACISRFDSAGPYMGWMHAKSVSILREMNPNIETYVWNDIFDAYHNAQPGRRYYMIGGQNGNPSGIWKTMDPKTIVISWNVNSKKEGFEFFAGKDPKFPTTRRNQMFYAIHGAIDEWLTVLADFEKKYGEDSRDAAVGVFYDTWNAQFWENLEPMAAKCKATGRWKNNKDPFQPYKYYGPDPNSDIREAPVRSSKEGLSFFRGTPGRIQFDIERSGNVQLTLSDALGRKVKAVDLGRREIGRHEWSWEPSMVPAGVYFLTLSQENLGHCITRKIVLM